MKVSNQLREKIENYFNQLFHGAQTNEENRYLENSTNFDQWLIANDYIKNIASSNPINLVPTKKLLFLSFNESKKLISNFSSTFGNYENDLTFSILKKRFEFYYNKLRDNFGEKLQKENQIFICPYCQRNYIGIFDNDISTKGYIAPDLDHFFPKSKYPFLAATISNLIPACSVCNQRLKKDKDTYEENIINPIENDIFENIEFNYNYKGPYIENYSKLTNEEKKYLEFFKIQEQYSIHTEIVNEIQVKKNKYNRVKKCHLLKCCPSLKDQKIIEDMVFHEYKYIDNKKTPLWKLKKDIYEKIKNEPK